MLRGWRILSVALTLSACAMLVSSSGCNMAQRNGRGHDNPDPLVGDMVPKAYAPGGAPVSAGPTTKSKTGVPPLPAATSAQSPAEIVQRGQPDPLFGDQQTLAIKGSGQVQPATGWQPSGPPGALTSGQGNAPVGVNLQAPVPMVGSPRAGTYPATVPASTWSSAAGMSYDQLQDALAKFNPKWQRQETVQGGFKFTCEIPNPRNPGFTRLYEATARDYKSALLAVLEQLARDGQGH